MKKFFFLLIIMQTGFLSRAQAIPEDFVYLKDVVPFAIEEVRYAGEHNFTGRPVPGYESEQIILTKKAAEALKKVQQELIQKDLMLKVFDAYRPQTAVNEFVAWARKPGDTLAKNEFYPDVEKSRLFELGYIASKSGHSRGGTIDLTLVNANTCKELDMGGAYDFFGEISHHRSASVTSEQKKNRELLRTVMLKNGFRSYSEEWWHYTLNAEPFPYQYFDFPIK
ncbi:M15 family metallopeptidase [uncultured Christiangramia sp.]|uniref:M15 family metallopeptidase n=1 Tax=Christiangramia sp. 3-2217-3z TaxID=3417564 RepID=UPI0026393359|nr:M15 family metallopeptidase [uncultured Christiangramia sp.]